MANLFCLHFPDSRGVGVGLVGVYGVGILFLLFLFLVDFAWPLSTVFISIIFPSTLVNSSHCLGGGFLVWLVGWQFFFGVFSSWGFKSSKAFLFLWGVRFGVGVFGVVELLQNFVLVFFLLGFFTSGVGTALPSGWCGSSSLSWSTLTF